MDQCNFVSVITVDNLHRRAHLIRATMLMNVLLDFTAPKERQNPTNALLERTVTTRCWKMCRSVSTAPLVRIVCLHTFQNKGK